MSSIDDLKRALDVHAPTTDADLGERTAAVARRVASVRRRRAAAGTALAVAAIGGGSLLAAGLPGHDTAPGPAQDPTSSTGDPGRATFRSESYGWDLLGSSIGEPGVSEVTLEVPVPQEPSFAIHCIPPVGAAAKGAEMPWVMVEVDGSSALQVSCGEHGPPDDDPAADLYAPNPGQPEWLSTSCGSGEDRCEEMGVAGRWFEPLEPDDSAEEVVVRLTDQEGHPYAGPTDGLILGVGVYRSPGDG